MNVVFKSYQYNIYITSLSALTSTQRCGIAHLHHGKVYGCALAVEDFCEARVVAAALGGASDSAATS